MNTRFDRRGVYRGRYLPRLTLPEKGGFELTWEFQDDLLEPLRASLLADMKALLPTVPTGVSHAPLPPSATAGIPANTMAGLRTFAHDHKVSLTVAVLLFLAAVTARRVGGTTLESAFRTLRRRLSAPRRAPSRNRPKVKTD